MNKIMQIRTGNLKSEKNADSMRIAAMVIATNTIHLLSVALAPARVVSIRIKIAQETPSARAKNASVPKTVCLVARNINANKNE